MYTLTVRWQLWNCVLRHFSNYFKQGAAKQMLLSENASTQVLIPVATVSKHTRLLFDSHQPYTVSQYHSKIPHAVPHDGLSAKDSNIDFSKLVSQIIKKASTIDKMITSIPKSTIKMKVQLILDLGVSEQDVVTLLTNKPSLLLSAQLEALVDGLKNYGLKETNISDLLSMDNFHQVNMKKFEAFFEILRSIGMAEKDIIQAFQANPNIVNLSSKQISTRVNNLQAVFKTADVFKLIVTTPNILFDDMKDITEKFMYVHFTMGISQRQMMYTSLFHYPLQHVINRHLFLKRTGFFVNEKNRNRGISSTNPNLAEIIDTSDGSFAAQFGKMSVQEYETFCELLAIELSNNSETDL